MIKPQAPCLGCVKRYLSCHATCIEYNSFREALDIYKYIVQENKEYMIEEVEYETNKSKRLKGYRK